MRLRDIFSQFQRLTPFFVGLRTATLLVLLAVLVGRLVGVGINWELQARRVRLLVIVGLFVIPWALLPRALITGLQRFAATHSIQDAAASIREVCETEGERLDSELSMIRYIGWAIPSIGFIGTVRGIGMALTQAHRAVEGDITGVTDALGVAFNSTFVALVISILLMFLMHQLQLQQERLVLDAQAYCDQRLLGHLKVTREV